ncbi:MAG: hypothetical protein AAB510_00110 [Patescibacteria group bacterium]
MKFFISNLVVFTFLAFVLLLPTLTLYADTNPVPPTTTPTPSGKLVNPIPSITSIPGLIKTILEGLLKIGLPLIALAIIYCGFLFVVAQGSEEKLTKAKDTLLYTIIGSAILLGSWAIAKLIETTVTGLGA